MNALIPLIVARKLGIHGSRATAKRMAFHILLVALVVAMLFIAQIFVTSMSSGIADKYALLGNGHLQVRPAEGADIPPLPEIYDIQEVAQTIALAYSATANRMIRLKGVGPSYFSGARADAMQVVAPEDEEEATSRLPRVRLSTTLAEALSVEIGDRIALMVVNATSTGTRLRPQLCIVSGLYDSGYRDLDGQLAFCDRDLLQSLFPDHADTYLELLVDGDLQATKQALIERGLSVTSWDEENQAVASNLATSRQAVSGVLAIIAVLCGYFISELAHELVEDDKRSIAKMKLLGMSEQMVTAIYFRTVMTVTVCSLILGGGVGLLLGLHLNVVLSFLASRNIPALSFYLLDFTMVVPVRELSLIMGILLAVATLSVRLGLRRIGKIGSVDCIHFA